MAYEIVMPQLSDSMEEGTLVSWKVKAGDAVKQGDVIAEVESDKAIMEVQSFKEGTVEELTLSEGESAPVGTVIARITVGSASEMKTEPAKAAVKELKSKEVRSEKVKVDKPKVALQKTETIVAKKELQVTGSASPKAKALAGKYGIDIEKLQDEGKLQKPAHTVDIKNYYDSRYFTPKALKLLNDYGLNRDHFEKSEKHTEEDVKNYIKKYNISLPEPLSTIQKSIIANVTAAAQKPVYHIYDSLDSRLLLAHSNEKVTMTLWLLKLFAEAMMQHETFRTTLETNGLQLWPNASISLAMANEKALYMPVFKACNAIDKGSLTDTMQGFKSAVKEGRLPPEAMNGSTFGISNLGMTGIKRFDAMINGNDCGIAAIGAESEGKIAVTLTLDHRIVNGWQGAAFMQSLKRLAEDPLFFKESK